MAYNALARQVTPDVAGSYMSGLMQPRNALAQMQRERLYDNALAALAGYGIDPQQTSTEPTATPGNGYSIEPGAIDQAQPTRPERRPSGSGGLADGLMEAADELGMDPIDLATIVSYETGGTFDPEKRGPRTQWGQHRGLIQFGEPQAEQYGVDWSDPVASQTGRNGAIVRYFRERGWQPGMGLLDAYSIVNAGSPGRYNASDANNGGAPGSVRDKVENQMAGHRRNAVRLFGA